MDSVIEHQILTPYDIYLFREGKHLELYDKLGSHLLQLDGREGIHFSVWAPNAKHLHVIGDFNNWHPGTHPLKRRDDNSGVWEGFIPDIPRGTLYKYHIESSTNPGHAVEKGDPFAHYWELPPRTASIAWDLRPSWTDTEWMQNRSIKNKGDSPWSIYEIHLGSWRRVPEDNNRWMTYRETSQELPKYLKGMGFTHVELLRADQQVRITRRFRPPGR
jgi:1,4-alpha-glucan branching enzyme